MKWKMSARTCLAVSLLALSLIATTNARIITVDDDGPADFRSIHPAMNDANDGDTVEIQTGTYAGFSNCDLDFQGKAITVRSTDPNDPSTVAQTIIDCNNLIRAFIFQTNEDASSVLDGLTIINGYFPGYGGAIYCSHSGPTIKNCTISNSAAEYGGAIRCEAGSWTVIRDCVFTNNSAKGGGAIYYYQSSGTIAGCVFRGNYSTRTYGGGVRIREGSLTITDCTFEDNSAFPSDDPDWANGGALGIAGDDISVTNCVFVGNSAVQGGAISAGEGEVSVANCLFVGNYALFGGALFAGGNQLRIENCTFTDNRASEGKTVFDGVGYIYAYPLELHVENSIIWDGPDSIVLGDDATLVVTFCDMPGVGPGYGNIDADPCFVNPGYWDPNGTPEDANDDFYVAGDCHLRSQAGRWNPVSQTWVNDDVTSACIDAANPDSPLDQEPFPNGGRANIGAYGTTTRASKSYFGNPPCETIVAGDVNGDCIIDARDFALLAGNWLISSPPPGRATNPDPPDGATDVDHLSFVSWTPGEGAASHDVYFGTTSPGTFQRNQTGTTFDRSPLAYQTTYYWRIDEVNATSTTTGTVWSFTTGERKARLCFPADTLVWADGKPVPIIEVRPGQKVRMVDSAPDADGKFLPIVETRPGRQVSVFNNAAEVEWLQEHGVGAYDCYDMTFETGNTIVVVHSHNFLTVAGQWVAVENLPSGSQLQSLNGPITVTSVVKRAMPFVGNAYNLKIKSANLFFVGKDGIAAVDCSKLPKE